MNSRDVRSDLYGYDRMSTAHLYAVPVLAAFDAIRNCSHCRRNTDDNCEAWREARKAVAVLTQEARRLAKGVDELLDATGGRTATSTSSRKGDALDKALRVLDARGAPGGESRVERIKVPQIRCC